MDFGTVAPELIPEIDFRLPPDTDLTKQVFKAADKVTVPQIYAGCSKWGRKEWVGMIYPEKTKETRFLDEYLKHFNTIELDAVFYKMPTPGQIGKWRERAEKERADFKFCPKVTQGISHIKRLKGAEQLTATYLESISHFGNYLGPAFLQLSDNFSPKNIDTLESYLEGLPSNFNLFVELRHKEWYTEADTRREVFEMFRRLNKGAVITDSSGRRDCVHMELPTPHAFIRFVGNGIREVDFPRIDEWTDRLASWINQGLQSVYFFLHQHDESTTPELADYTIKKFNEKLNARLERPQFLGT